MQPLLSSHLEQSGRKPQLLAVDDEPDNLDLLYRTFHRQFEVLRAGSGQEGLQVLETHPDVAVIISDQRMPGMSGTVFLRETAARYPNTVRIMLTGYADVENLVSAINEGRVFKYVSKPWEETNLRAVVAQALETHRVLKAHTKDLQRSLQQKSLLHRITRTIRSSLESQAIFAAITRELGQALAVDSCALSLWGHQDTYMQCVGLYEGASGTTEIAVDETGASNGLSLPQSEVPIASNPVMQRLLATQSPLAIDDFTQRPDLQVQDQLRRLQTQALLVVPLITEGQIIGSISLRYIDHPYHWQEDEILLAEAVAEQAAIAVQQSHLYQTTRAQAEQLLALDQQKTAFFQNVSHEFRTPLTLMLSPLEAAVEEHQGLSYDQATMALRNTRRLLRLVNQLLDLQRLDADQVQPAFRPVDLAVFVGDILNAFRPYCDRKGLQLLARLSPCPQTYVDPEKFDKVLYNLLSNAVKFTPTGGTITVTLDAEDAESQGGVLSVQDTGIGIREGELAKLFERFQQADGSTNRQYEGTGLGLALVKDIIDLHGGEVEVASTYGIGTTFKVLLPRGKHHLPPEQVIEAAAQAESRRADIELADITLPEEARSQGFPKQADNPDACGHILVVDDNSDVRTYVAESLHSQGYDVHTASHGKAALDIMNGLLPDLLLTDLMMPGMSGLDLIQAVRQDSRLQGVPIILLTAKADTETRIESIEQGADAYLGKPFNRRELLAEVRNLIALKANERRVAELNQYLTQSVLQRFLPPALVAKASVGKLQLGLQPETRLVTVLFSDIVGYTALSDQLGPRRIAQLLNEYLIAMTDAVFDSGGTVDKFMGDGVMALFGAPEDLSPADQAHQAMQAVARMQEALASLNQRLQLADMPAIRVRYGLHQGEAVVGLFGSAARSDYTAIGPCVNVASRLQAMADPDSVLVSWELAQHFPAECIAAARCVSLRGLGQPMLAYSLKQP